MRIISFIYAVKRFLLAWVRTRRTQFLTPEQTQARLRVCEEPCPFFSPRFRSCCRCGCFVDTKAMLRTEDCPVKKWPALT
jgi:hypothetical protein